MDPNRPSELRMYLVARTDLPEMSPGKLAVQAGHAFTWLVEKVRLSHPQLLADYNAIDTPKICVAVSSLAALQRAQVEAEACGLPAVTITDAARTCFAEPTQTVCAIGPCRREDLPKYLARLRLY